MQPSRRRCGPLRVSPDLPHYERPSGGRSGPSEGRCDGLHECGVTRSTPVTKFFNQHSAAPVDMEFRCPVGVDSCQAFVMLPPAPKAEPKAPRGKAP
jgi:hypothetical protein